MVAYKGKICAGIQVSWVIPFSNSQLMGCQIVKPNVPLEPKCLTTPDIVLYSGQGVTVVSTGLFFPGVGLVV